MVVSDTSSVANKYFENPLPSSYPFGYPQNEVSLLDSNSPNTVTIRRSTRDNSSCPLQMDKLCGHKIGVVFTLDRAKSVPFR